MKFRLPALMLAGALLPTCGFQNGIGGPIVDITLSSASGPIGSLVTLTGADFSLVDSFSVGEQKGILLQKSATSAVGFVMPGTTTGNISITTTLGGLAVSADSFTAAPSAPPANAQGAKLVGTGAVDPAQQGGSLAISADGNTALIGAFGDDGGNGAAWVFTRAGGSWTQQGVKLVGTGAIGAALQGISVSLSADGNTALVGGYNENAGEGAVWAYTRSGGTWTQQGPKIFGTGASGAASQGSSVSLSADGNTALVGGPNDGANTGAVWVFTRSNGVWSQLGTKLVGSGAVGAAQQGYSVALSADGNTALVGALLDDGGLGAAWVFTRNGDSWSQQGTKLVGSGAVGASQQGGSVAISADGNTALVGGTADDGNIGAAWVFTRNNGSWSQQGSKLVGTGAIGGAAQGFSVAISADGDTALVGGYNDDTSNGATWVFGRSSGAWSQQGLKLVGAGANGAAAQGTSVALSADGSTALSGGSSDSFNAGAVWVWVP